MTRKLRSQLKAGVALAAVFAQFTATVLPAGAFCGFYVAKADTKMLNKSSNVVLARNGRQTAITMASDYEGKPDEFALVVPVPTFIEKNQISVVDTKIVDHLDAYTAPRLVEYFDPDPCHPQMPVSALTMFETSVASAPAPAPPPVAYAGVKVEARYDVAEYDISILSAEQSNGLIQWLNDNGYKIPAGAEPVISSYIKQKMHFFIAKVNVKRMNDLGRAYLRPLQVRYESAKFMLPLRLGTVNASGPQDLVVYALTRQGRVEASNYRTVKMTSDVNVPLFIANDFPNFYKAAFDRVVERQNKQGVFVEYAWDMNWCDPCASKPMENNELAQLGALWVGSTKNITSQWPPGSNGSTFVTRLHVRYDAKTFPEDLNFIETADRDNFQTRYVLNHPFESASCQATALYRQTLLERFKEEAKNASDLTGWPIEDIKLRMARTGETIPRAN